MAGMNSQRMPDGRLAKNALSTQQGDCQVSRLSKKLSDLVRYSPLMRLPFLQLVIASALLCRASAFGAGAPAPTTPKPPPPIVWQAHLPSFDEAAYAKEVEALIATFEKHTGKKLVPGEKKKVGLKIYTDSGPGMATPIPLVKAVIHSLEERGFEKKNIFLVGLN
jgi:hypothetical protein